MTQFEKHNRACNHYGGCENNQQNKYKLLDLWEKGSVPTFSAKASAVSLQDRSIWNCISKTSSSLSSWEEAESYLIQISDTSSNLYCIELCQGLAINVFFFPR